MERREWIRRRVAALGPRGRGARIPEELRRAIAGYARGRRREGVGFHELARETGVSHETIRRYVGERGERRDVVPVEIVADEVTVDDVDRLAVVSPGGYRVEGLDLAGVAALLRILD
jgi:hypothetical protein